jgi:oligoribonuclease NrnB/cAMP/cGMP phosphodiesterase (DHH superfamily)
MFQERKVFHLSHIDLDGYTCQLLSSYIFKDVRYFNSNYGKEILNRIDEIFEELEELKDGEKVFLLITDLNLSENEAEYIEDKIDESPLNIHIQLLDHHITGEEVSKKFNWYYLHDGKSATQITYEYFKKNFGFGEKDDTELERFVSSVNALDIWLQDTGELFEYGKVMMRLISSARELNKMMFPDEDGEYKRFALENAKKIFSMMEIERKDIHLDDQIHHIKKSFFRKDKDDTFDNLLTEYIVDLLTENRDYFTIKYKGYKGLFTYMLGNTSIVGNGFLSRNPDYHFFVDSSPKGNLSFRADGKVDVSIMAKEIANGGGHKNASGARIKNFREHFSYSKAQESIQNFFYEREYLTDILKRI